MPGKLGHYHFLGEVDLVDDKLVLREVEPGSLNWLIGELRRRVISGVGKVKDANGQSLAYVYGRETKADADIAKVLATMICEGKH